MGKGRVRRRDVPVPRERKEAEARKEADVTDERGDAGVDDLAST